MTKAVTGGANRIGRKCPIPITIENAVLIPPGVSSDEGIPVSVPVSELVDLSGKGECLQSPPLLEVEVVQNVLEVTFTGQAVVIAGSDCSFSTLLDFDVVLQVPIVSQDPAAFVYLVSQASGTFQALSGTSGGPSAFIDLNPLTGGSSTQVPAGRFSTGFSRHTYTWSPPAFSPVLVDSSGGTTVATLFPGDTVRIPVRLNVDLRGAPGDETQGTFSAQFEFRTRFPVPEPSASLSLPLGMAWLAGLSMIRGGV